MGCGSCSSGGGCNPAGCKSNGSCLTDGGCSKLDVYDWLSDMDLPAHYKAFSIVEIKFKGSRKEFFDNNQNIYFEPGELVVVEGSQGGYDVGHVSLTGELVRMQLSKKNVRETSEFKKILRKATPADVERWKAAKEMESGTMHKARTIALKLGLKMKLSDVDFQGDKSKASFYYTADERVDFRELIKMMAETFKVRIEMRQIGMRQEASRLGGMGSCGRELCCSTWLTEFRTVSTAAARYQNLSLNTLKLAGQCGKLKCCLNYELDSYIDALRDIPNNVNILQTERGPARLQKTDIFKKIMWFSYQDITDWIPLEVTKVREILALNQGGQKAEDLKTFEYIIESNKEPIVAFNFENAVGQDSITRLDDRNKNRNKKKRKPSGSNAGPQQAKANAPSQPGQENRRGSQPQGNRKPNPGNRPPQEGGQKGPKLVQQEGPPRNNRPQGEKLAANPQAKQSENANNSRRPDRPRPNNQNKPKPTNNPNTNPANKQ